ncbi:MAG: methyltransferase domain-containing protein [Cyanothece sp. SIO2G6]|nr:methyltransferase domain-containing protein [Cyanothece sp. SIO2G6]
MDNQYTSITDYYDLWVTSGYYDYHNKALVAQSLVGEGCQILELGVGTGLLAEKYIAIDPSCEFTGIDFTASMLDVGRKKLGDKVQLIEADVVTMKLGRTFDVAISNGGIWVMYDCDDHWEVGTLVPDIDANFKAMRNVAQHLQSGGLLLLNVQTPHDDFEKQLAPNIVYSQAVEPLEDTPTYYSIKKSYFFKNGEEILSQDQHQITYFKQNAYPELFEQAGFEFVKVSAKGEGDRFAVYRKR